MILKDRQRAKKIMCNDNLCSQRTRCLGTFSNCPYPVSYISTDTSIFEILVEDILHLITEEGQPKVVDAWITFGCGQVQNGSFLRFVAPNGPFGLGREKISVPSMLSRIGLTTDSFSMCFGRDGFGTISFGDKGSPDQDETPFISFYYTASTGFNKVKKRTTSGFHGIKDEYTKKNQTQTRHNY